jgi:hypothetical protein
MSFIINNQEILQTNSSRHSINTRNKHHLLRPNAKLSCFQKSTFYAGIKIFNSLPPSLTVLKNYKGKFKSALRKYQHTHPFYSLDEFFMCRDNLKHFCKMFSVFYIVNLCIFCIYDLFHILLSLTDFWVHRMYVYMYVCTYICTYVLQMKIQ